MSFLDSELKAEDPNFQPKYLKSIRTHPEEL
eukprot:UN05185